MFKTLRWEDWLGVALGMWLCVSPWALGYSDNAAVTNALAVGSLLVIFELLDLGPWKNVEEMLDIFAGSWLTISPLVLGFADVTPAALNAVAVGTLTAFFAIWALSPFDAMLAKRRHGRSAP
jgi:hypothetical protein